MKTNLLRSAKATTALGGGVGWVGSGGGVSGVGLGGEGGLGVGGGMGRAGGDVGARDRAGEGERKGEKEEKKVSLSVLLDPGSVTGIQGYPDSLVQAP